MIDGTAKIVLTRRWPAAVEHEMAKLGDVTLNTDDVPLSPEQLMQALAEADVVCPTVTDRMPAEVFAGATMRTRLLANFGVGFNHIDLAGARARGIAVTNTPGVLTEATAEIALTLMMMSARRAGAGERHVRAGAWTGWRPTHMLSTAVMGATLGVIGMGRIGTAFARMAHHGLGMPVLYNSRSQLAPALEESLGATYVPLDELLARADFVSLHCPATPQTHHLLDAAKLRLMQPHAHLINTARGDIIDEQALVAALEAGQLAGAGLDVYEHEPQVHAGLQAMEQVVLLPHMGSGTHQTRHAMGMRALANVAAFLASTALPDQVDA